MQMRTRQRGLTILGFLFVAAVVVVVRRWSASAWCRRTSSTTRSRRRSSRRSPTPRTSTRRREVRKAFQKRADAGYIESVPRPGHRGHQGQATRSTPASSWTRKLPLVGNVSLLLDFEATATR